MTEYGEQGATAEDRFGSLGVMSRMFDSLNLSQGGMLSRDELLNGLKQQDVGEKAIATLQKTIGTDGVVTKKAWKAALEQAAPALQAAATQAAGNAALDLAGIIDILNIVHTRPADADFAQLHQWKSLLVTRAKNQFGKPSLVFCSTEGELQFGWPVYEMQNKSAPSAACTIPKTEERGISPRQLLALWVHIKTHCVKEVRTDNCCCCSKEKLLLFLLLRFKYFDYAQCVMVECSICVCRHAYRHVYVDI